MGNAPYKLRVRRVREDVVISLLAPAGRSGWVVRESVNQGALTLRLAIENLSGIDMTDRPRMRAALVGANVVDIP